MPPAYQNDSVAMRSALMDIMQHNQVFEIRALVARIRGDRRSGTFSGYYDYDHIDKAVEDFKQLEFAAAVYFTPNPVKPDLLARAYNRARLVTDREPLTTDKDILKRNWLLVDVDPVRPKGISATAAEKAAAEGMITAIDSWLWERGIPPGIIGDSGNGCHLMIPIDLPTDDGGFCKKMLTKLAKEFNTAECEVDLTVFNAARIWKLPGTLACKGDNAPEIGREWRMAKILTICEGMQANVRTY